jgi:hypothetical protein
LTVELDDPQQVCALKHAQHEQSGAEGEFDDKACLRSEHSPALADALLETPAPINDVAPELTCSEDDPSCRSLPPASPTQPSYARISAPATLPLAMAWVERLSPRWDPTQLGEARDGVRRRVERPPSGSTLS